MIHAYDTIPMTAMSHRSLHGTTLVSLRQRNPAPTQAPTPATFLTELFLRVTEYYYAHQAMIPVDMAALLLDMRSSARDDAWLDQVATLAEATTTIAASPAITDLRVLNVVRYANVALHGLA